MANTVFSSPDVNNTLSEISLRYENPECFLLNSVQCKHLSDALLGLSEQCEGKSDFNPDSRLFRAILCPNGWKEIYRAAKEAEIYLHDCSSCEWPIKFLTRSNGEAYSLHLHDLAFCSLLVHLSTYPRKIREKICHFYKEMDRFIQICDEYADEMQLIKTCEQFAEKNGHRPEDKNIVEVSKFLGLKLKRAILIPVSTEDESAGVDISIPTWLEIDPEHFVLKSEVIGKGSYGLVYEGSWLGVRVAAKKMPMDEVSKLEVSILAKLQSPFIVHLIGTCVKDTHLYLVMELVSSNLEQFLEDGSQRNRPPLSLLVAVDIMLQISRAMEHVHSKGIMHLDLKASNVLFELSSLPELREEGYGRVKLCDFGTASTRKFSFRSTEETKGTCYWRAPEVFPLVSQEAIAETRTPDRYTNKADVYSFAMTCYQILTGEQPFSGVNPRELHRRIKSGERPILKPSICPVILANCIEQCWDTNPDRRPSFKSVSHFLRMLKLCLSNSLFHPKETLSNKIYQELGFVEGEKKSIFSHKLKKWKENQFVEMHGRLDHMLFMSGILTLEMRRGIAIDIACFIASINAKSAKRFLQLKLSCDTIFLDWKLKPIFAGVASARRLGRGGGGRKEAKRYEEFKNIQDFGGILVQLATGCTCEEMPCSIASIQGFIECSQMEFVDKQLVEEVGEKQLWEVVRWCKLGLWCLSASVSQQPNIHTVVQFLKEGAPSGDSTLQDYLSAIPTIEKVRYISSDYVDPTSSDQETVMLRHAWESFVPRRIPYSCFKSMSCLLQMPMPMPYSLDEGRKVRRRVVVQHSDGGMEVDEGRKVRRRVVVQHSDGGMEEDGFALDELFG